MANDVRRLRRRHVASYAIWQREKLRQCSKSLPFRKSLGVATESLGSMSCWSMVAFMRGTVARGVRLVNRREPVQGVLPGINDRLDGQ